MLCISFSKPVLAADIVDAISIEMDYIDRVTDTINSAITPNTKVWTETDYVDGELKIESYINTDDKTTLTYIRNRVGMDCTVQIKEDHKEFISDWAEEFLFASKTMC